MGCSIGLEGWDVDRSMAGGIAGGDGVVDSGEAADWWER